MCLGLGSDWRSKCCGHGAQATGTRCLRPLGGGATATVGATEQRTRWGRAGRNPIGTVRFAILSVDFPATRTERNPPRRLDGRVAARERMVNQPRSGTRNDRPNPGGAVRRRARCGPAARRRRRSGPPAITSRRRQPRRYRSAPPRRASRAHSSPRVVTTLTRALGGDLPRGLVRLLGAVTLADGRTRAIATAGLLWLVLQAGWEVGLVDAEAGIWLAAGVVAAALHGLAGSTGSGRPGPPPDRTVGGRPRRRREQLRRRRRPPERSLRRRPNGDP